MSEPAPRNAILASPSIAQPGELDRLNTILENAGLGRPLGEPVQITPAVAVVPVSGDPEDVAAVMRRVDPDGDDGDVPHEYSVDTVDPDGKTKQSPPPTEPLNATEQLSATGLKTGHGTVTWTPIERYEAPQQPPWPPHFSSPDVSSPVVVLLDSGVRRHAWLPRHPAFFDVEKPGPEYGLPVAESVPENGKLGAYWGHATFLAGLIRLKAPDARVVSLRVMNDNGKVQAHDVINALDWLYKEYIGKKHRRVDVVLMAFGRPQKPGEAEQRKIRRWINKLGREGVKFVASAGNDHSHTETFPACLATEQNSPVVSVGAGTSAADHEPYSNHGPWVLKWRPGAHVSLMPLTAGSKDANGYAVWSGTSFAAAIYAGELAQQLADERKASPGS
jgi:subtilisin family serine protease